MLSSDHSTSCMQDIPSLLQVTLPIPPSCIAFPSASLGTSHFVVGTYHLEKPVVETGHAASQDKNVTPRRSGSLILHKLHDGQDDQLTLHDIATVTSHAAILDIAFSPHVLTLFVACTSTGTLDFYELDTERGNIVLSQSVQAFDSSLLILDVVFHPSRADCLGVTLSDGRVCLVRLPTTIAKGFRESIRPVNPIELSKEHVVEVSRHELEAWTLEVGHDGQTIFSGGDDCQFRCASIPMSDEHAKSTTRWSDRKLHGAGVTAILPLQSPSGRAKPQETFVLTGSYDDHVRLIKLPDMQIVKRAQVLAEENLGGGVWRLALMDSSTQSEDSQTKDTYHVLASCMHAGVRILEIKHMTGSNHEISDSHDASQDEWSIRIAASFTEHKSMNYASAVRPISMPAQQKGETRTYTVVSTSFYDRLLCVWRCTI